MTLTFELGTWVSNATHHPLMMFKRTKLFWNPTMHKKSNGPNMNYTIFCPYTQTNKHTWIGVTLYTLLPLSRHGHRKMIEPIITALISIWNWPFCAHITTSHQLHARKKKGFKILLLFEVQFSTSNAVSCKNSVCWSLHMVINWPSYFKILQ